MPISSSLQLRCAVTWVAVQAKYRSLNQYATLRNGLIERTPYLPYFGLITIALGAVALDIC